MDTTKAKPRPLRRTTAREVPYVLSDDRELPAGEAPRWVLLTPTVREVKEMQDAVDGGNLRLFEVVVRFVARIEGHPDVTADAFGAPGSDVRRAYLDAVDLAVLNEVAEAVSGLMVVTDAERKNSSAPSVSQTTTGGAPGVAGSAPTSTPSDAE